MNTKLMALVAVVWVSGCVSVSAIPLGSEVKRAPVKWNDVVVYRSEASIPSKYEEVAMLTASGDAEDMGTDQGDLVKKMRVIAGKRGANGLMLGSFKDPTTGERIANAFLGTGVERSAKAIAIFVPAGATASSSPAFKVEAPKGKAKAVEGGGDTASGDADTRLQRLKALYDKGLVTKEEYAAKRKEILGSM